MKDNADANTGPLRKRDEPEPYTYVAGQGPAPAANGNGRAHTNGHARTSVFDFWTALEVLAHRWYWLALGGMLGACAFFYLGNTFIKAKYTATAQLLRND